MTETVDSACERNKCSRVDEEDLDYLNVTGGDASRVRWTFLGSHHVSITAQPSRAKQRSEAGWCLHGPVRKSFRETIQEGRRGRSHKVGLMGKNGCHSIYDGSGRLENGEKVAPRDVQERRLGRG